MFNLSTFNIFVDLLWPILAAYIIMLAIKPKENRIKIYNDLLKDFVAKLDDTQHLAIQYWASEQKLTEIAGYLTQNKTKCYGLLEIINRKKCKLYARQYNEISKKMGEYFDIITDFGTKAEKDYSTITEKANNILGDLTLTIEKAKFPNKIWNQITTKLK